MNTTILTGEEGDSVRRGTVDPEGAAIVEEAASGVTLETVPPMPQQSNSSSRAVPIQGTQSSFGDFLRCGLRSLGVGCGVARGYAGQASGWLRKESRSTIEQILGSNPIYVASPAVEESLADPILGAAARKAKMAGQEKLAAAKNFLRSLLLYRRAYAKDGTSNPRTLIVFTNRLFEDLLLYLVADYRKTVAKDNFQLLIAPRPAGNSLNVGNYSMTPVEMIPYEVRDIVNEILRANAEKATQYFLVPGQGARESAEMPRLLQKETNTSNNIAAYNMSIQPAVNYAQKLLNTRSKTFTNIAGQGISGVSRGPMGSMAAIAGPFVPASAAPKSRGMIASLMNRLTGSAPPPSESPALNMLATVAANNSRKRKRNGNGNNSMEPNAKAPRFMKNTLGGARKTRKSKKSKKSKKSRRV